MPILKNDTFYCEHLGALKNDIQDIQNFSVKDVRGEGLADYLKNAAANDENSGIMRTYFVRDNSSSEFVGYFSLKSGLISGNEQERDGHIEFDTLPGVELANFAINSAYIDAHPDYKGIGAIIFSDFVIPIIEKSSREIGIRVVYIFALPFERLISRYEAYGFKRLDAKSEDSLHARLKPVYDESCIFMYQHLL